jgi:hypothetical protein
MPLTNYEITPYEGVGELKLGMSAEQVHDLLGEPNIMSNEDNRMHECYDLGDLTLFYNLPERTCSAISMGSKCNPTYQGFTPMNVEWEAASLWLNSIDNNVEDADIYSSGLIGKETGIYLNYGWNWNDNGEDLYLVDTVLVYQKDYWERKLNNERKKDKFLEWFNTEFAEDIDKYNQGKPLQTKDEFNSFFANNLAVRFSPEQLDRLKVESLKWKRKIIKNVYELELGKKIGSINLGMTRAEIIDLIEESNFSRNDSIYGRTDSHHKYELIVEYDKETDFCNRITVSSPAELWYEGKNILGLGWVDALNWMKELDSSCELDEDQSFPCCISHKLQMSINSSDTGEGFDSEGNGDYVLVVGSLTIATPKYWDIDEEKQEVWIQKMMAELPSEEECARELGLL